MTQYKEVEGNPQCRLIDVPVIVAGTVSDALCCSSPRRDFATEAEFRLRNAVRMYPPIYRIAASSYGYEYNTQRVPTPAGYVHNVYAAPGRQVQVVEPSHYPPHSMLGSPQPTPRLYTYDKEFYPVPPPEIASPILPRIRHPLTQPTAYKLGGSVSLQSYAVKPMEPSAHFILATSSTYPASTPRDVPFAPAWSRTVEVVKVEEQTEVELAKKENLGDPKTEKASTQGSQKEEDTKLDKEALVTPKASEPKKKVATKKGPWPVTQNEHREKDNEGETQEQRDDKTMRREEDEKAPSPRQHQNKASAPKKGKPDTQKPPKDSPSSEERDGSERKKLQEEAGDKVGVFLLEEDPVETDEIEAHVFEKVVEAKLWQKMNGEAVSRKIPPLSVASASTVAGVDMMTHGPVKVVGGPLSPSYDDKRFEADVSSDWPVGYVPPADDMYKELVVGHQVYLEGGTFYLSETGAYLLGLRD